MCFQNIDFTSLVTDKRMDGRQARKHYASGQSRAQALFAQYAIRSSPQRPESGCRRSIWSQAGQQTAMAASEGKTSQHIGRTD